MEWAMALLLNNPESLEKVKSEINKSIGTNRFINVSDIPNLPYLANVVKETLRLYPIGPLLVPRQSSNECTVGGYYVPSGTILLVNAYAVHRDPKLWEEPTRFRPERFEHLKADMGRAYLPFGSGRRSCPGENMGFREVMLALGAMIQCFEWERVGEEAVDMSEGTGISLPMAKPLVAKYRPRDAMRLVLSGL